MTALPANLPSVAHAKLPATYEAAKTALAECSQIDECQDWADKMEALASYAKQADDDTLRRMCDRIQARAVRRCGELLKQIEPGKNRYDDRREGGHPPNRAAAARDAGLSDHQRKTALRVANIPEPEFEAAVEAVEPPPVTALAERGKQAKPTRPLVDLEGRDPETYALSTQGQGQLRSFAKFASETDPIAIARGAMRHEIKAIREHIATIDAWLDRLAVSLEG